MTKIDEISYHYKDVRMCERSIDEYYKGIRINKELIKMKLDIIKNLKNSVYNENSKVKK